MSADRTFRVQALLFLHRALLTMVTPELRGIAIQLGPKRIEARFIYDAEPDEEQREIVADVETEVIADFLPDVEIAFRAEGSPPAVARSLLPGEEWVYLRRE